MLSFLVIDDEYGLAEVLAATLGDAGHRVTVAYSGEQGIQRLRTESFDAVLLDLMMPGMDGERTLAAIRRSDRYRTLPVVLLGEPALDYVRPADSHAGFLAKPFSIAELLAELERLGVRARGH